MGDIASIVAGMLGVVLVAVLGWVLVWRRSLTRRLSVLALRLGEAGVALPERERLESSVALLERAADEAVVRVDASADAADRMAQALDVLHQGVVLCDEEGTVRYRNRLAESFAGARHAAALAEQAIGEVLSTALQGHAQVRMVDLYGPPRRNLQVTAVPLTEGPRAVGAVAVIEDIS